MSDQLEIIFYSASIDIDTEISLEIGTKYDDAHERIVLTQENFEIFTRKNLSKFPKHRIVTAHRLFYGLLTSAEP